MESENDQTLALKQFQALDTLSPELLETMLNKEEIVVILQEYVKYRNQVRYGLLGKTAQFWVTVIEHTHLIMMLQYSVKTNNLPLFLYCNGTMAELFFAFDHQNYSRSV